MAVSPERSAIRSAGRAARRSMQGNDRATAEQKLVGHLQSLHIMAVPSVGVFVAHDGEPDLTPLVYWLWEQGTTVALPVLADDPSDPTMRFVPWTQGTRLEAGRYDIPVPPTGAASVEDLAITPLTLVVSLTGFDPAGNRIGRGGGFFDRYLANYRGAVVGVGFESQRFDHVPIEDHDIGLPLMVTDLGIRFFA